MAVVRWEGIGAARELLANLWLSFVLHLFIVVADCESAATISSLGTGAMNDDGPKSN